MESVSEARVVFECSGCKAKSVSQKEVKHAQDCKKKALARHCEH